MSIIYWLICLILFGKLFITHFLPLNYYNLVIAYISKGLFLICLQLFGYTIFMAFNRIAIVVTDWDLSVFSLILNRKVVLINIILIINFFFKLFKFIIEPLDFGNILLDKFLYFILLAIFLLSQICIFIFEMINFLFLFF